MAQTQPVPPKKPAKGSRETNPFNIGVDGVRLFFEKAKGVAILLIVLSVVGSFTNRSNSDTSSQYSSDFGLPSLTPEQWAVAILLVVLVGTAAFLISALIAGMSAYTSAQTSKGHSVKISEAFRATLNNIWSFAWLHLLMNVKIFLWTLLFIVPGIIMAVRYSFAEVSFFDKDKNLRGNAAIKDSLELTRGGWFTIFASSTLLGILTLGILSSVVTAGSRAVLYQQYRELQTTNTDKPATHWLSYATLFVPLGLLILVLALVVAVFSTPNSFS